MNIKDPKKFLDACQTGFLGIPTDTFGKDKDSRITAANSVKALLTKYVTAPNEIGTQKAKALFTGTSSDLPVLSTNSFDVTYAGQHYDLDWMASFKEVPVEAGRDFFEIVTIDNNLSVRLVPEGGKLPLEKLSGSKLTVYVNKYGQAIQWTDEMIRFRQLGAMLETAESAVEAHWADKADRHYALLTASVGATTTYQTATGRSETDNDIETLNKAYADLVVANKDKFRGMNASVPVIVYAPITARSRIEKAINKTVNDFAGSPARISFPIRVVYTLNSNLPTVATGMDFALLMVLPGRKIQMGQALAPTLYNEQDILSLSYIQTAWQYYGAGVGATSQIRKVNLG